MRKFAFAGKESTIRGYVRILVAVLLFVSFASAQTKELEPGDNLVTDGIPKIPLSLAEEVSRYGASRMAGALSWHPKKREMLILAEFCDTYQVHELKMPGGARRQITFFNDHVYWYGDSANTASYDPVDGNYFVFSKASGGNENNQNYRYDFNSGKVTLLTDGTSRNSMGVWSNAGTAFAYTSTRRTGKDLDLYVVNPLHPESDRLASRFEGGGWVPLDWSPDDRFVLVGEYVSATESYLSIVDLATGEKTLLTPRSGSKESISYGGAMFSKDGKGVYVTTDLDSEFQRLAYLDLSTKRFKFLTTTTNRDVDQFALSPDGTILAYVTNEDGVSVLHFLQPATGREKPAPKLPIGVIFRGLKWRKTGDELALSLTTPRSPYDIYSVQVPTGKVERWTESETGGIPTKEFIEPEVIRWKSFDNRMISGFLYRPPAKFTGKLPVVIYFHGGPEEQYTPEFLGQDNYFVNELGVARIYPNIRGSSGFGKTFLKLDNGFLREDAYKDVGALLDWIKSRPDLDSERIMVAGDSYGGNVALAVAAMFNERIRCAWDVAGIANFVTFLESTSAYRQDLRRVEYGDERDSKVRAFLERISPVRNAEKIKKPLFVIQGKNDPRVPQSEAEQIVASVRKNGTPVWYLLAKDEGHGFGNKKNIDFLSSATALFIKEYLLK